jgi:hypothetical protein
MSIPLPLTARRLFNTGDVYFMGRKIGNVTNCEVDWAYTLVEHKSEMLVTLAQAYSELKVSAKADAGTFDGGLLASLLSTTPSSGQHQQYTETMGSAGTTYTATHGATYALSLQVVDATGAVMTQVPSGPAAGQFSVTAAGVYTFGTSAVYTVTYDASVAGTGNTIHVANSLQGLAPTYAVEFYNTTGPGSVGVKLYAAACPKLALAFKAGAFVATKLEFHVQDDGSGNTFDFYYV